MPNPVWAETLGVPNSRAGRLAARCPADRVGKKRQYNSVSAGISAALILYGPESMGQRPRHE